MMIAYVQMPGLGSYIKFIGRIVGLYEVVFVNRIILGLAQAYNLGKLTLL